MNPSDERMYNNADLDTLRNMCISNDKIINDLRMRLIINTKEDIDFETWFDSFYDSDEAQDAFFGNYNNATRDEQVARFSARAAWNRGL